MCVPFIQVFMCVFDCVSCETTGKNVFHLFDRSKKENRGWYPKLYCIAPFDTCDVSKHRHNRIVSIK